MNPYVSPKSDSTISAQSEQRTTLPTFLGKWIRILLACSTIASMIAAFITQITQGFGTSYGRAAITSQLAFGFVSLVTLAILQAIRAYRSSSADLWFNSHNKSLHTEPSTLYDLSQDLYHLSESLGDPVNSTDYEVRGLPRGLGFVTGVVFWLPFLFSVAVLLAEAQASHSWSGGG